jgi:hypothetical protein
MSAPSDKKTDVPQDNSDIATAILALAESIKAGQTQPAVVNPQLEGMLKLLEDREQARPHENLFSPPMISHFNPLGDRDHPKPDLKTDIRWVGYRMTKETLRRDEIELVNKLEPGEFRVTKSDGRTIPFTVTAKKDDNGKLERMNIHFPCKSNEDRSNHLSMESYLREVLGESASTESLRAQIEQLKIQLAGYQG